jgi:hypothetical protein
MAESSNLPAIVQPTELADLAMSPQGVLKQAALIQQVMQAVMRDGEHYGVIPGTSGKKSLLKSGAEKLCFTFGLSNRLEIQTDNLPNGHREYRIICNLFDRVGNQRGQGVGSASTMESKHRYRGAAGKPCPKCMVMACMPSKKEFGGGYYCNPKSGGCGWSTKAGTAECKTLDQIPSVRAENQDPADQYNTVLKMAKKRALVDAVLTATAASDIFAQDLEDLEDKIEEPAATPAARTGGPAVVDPLHLSAAEQAAAEAEAEAEKKNAAPAVHPAIAAARDLYNAANKMLKGTGAKIMARACALHGAADPKAVAADQLDAFGHTVAALAKAADYDALMETIARLEVDAQEAAREAAAGGGK